jgi:hypothetical protein
MIDYTAAILSRRYAGKEWTLNGNEYTGLTWLSEGAKPSQRKLLTICGMRCKRRLLLRLQLRLNRSRRFLTVWVCLRLKSSCCWGRSGSYS